MRYERTRTFYARRLIRRRPCKKFGTVANRIALADDTLSEAEVKSRAMSELGYKVTATDLELAAAKNEHLNAAKFRIAGAQTTVAS